MTIRVVELFAGIGAQAEALKELGLDYKVVATSDIDKHANIGYEAIHGSVNNLGDITKIDSLPPCDLLTYSWPCQSLSIAGKQSGMVEGSGTTSSLLWEVGRLLRDLKNRGQLPKILVAENVDAVLNRNNIKEFKRWISTLKTIGYTSSYTIMNAKDYGTPQNRKRMFMVSTLNLGTFIFPDPNPDGRILRDILEDNVPDSFFLSPERLATFERHKERNDAKGNGFGFDIHIIVNEKEERERGDCAQAVSTIADRYCQTWVGIPKIAGNLNNPHTLEQHNRIYDDDGVAPTIFTPHGCDQSPKIETSDLRIRYLTPRECLRLQAFPDEAIDKLYSVLRKTALYKVAGNSIAVCCLKAIFKGIYIDKSFYKCSLDGWLENGMPPSI